MKKISVAIVIMIILATFTGCGRVSSLSGKYVNEQDKSEYFKFSGESTVEMHSGNQKITGTYFIYSDAVICTFGSGDNSDSIMFVMKNKSTLIYNGVGVAFVKKTFFNFYWKVLALLIIIVYGIMFIINFIKNLKKNDYNVSKAIDEALDQTNDMIDKM